HASSRPARPTSTIDQPGNRPTAPIDLLVRAELVRACPDRDLEWHLSTNLTLRWFVGLPLLASAPTIPRWPASTPGSRSMSPTCCSMTCWHPSIIMTQRRLSPHPRSSYLN